MEKAFDFLREHKDVAFATSRNGRPQIRVFQVMRQEGTTLYFATSPKKEVFRQLQDFSLPVERLDYYDLTPTPPTFEHYELENK